MANPQEKEFLRKDPSAPRDDLSQALMRLTSPQVDELRAEISHLSARLEQIAGLEGADTELHQQIASTRRSLLRLEEQLELLRKELKDPVTTRDRFEPQFLPVLKQNAQEKGDETAEALAPVIGPAIRHQIREAKDDIIDALYPLIGQIIAKAISESLRELTRNIDARLRQQFNFRDRLNRTLARLRGVSDAEYLLRDSLPFSIEHVFLVHRSSGILLEHLSTHPESSGEMDTISAMLTAIQDFVRDSFGQGQGDLEEITHGDLRILLESGQYAYVAVVLSGVEPPGYNQLINEVIHDVNMKQENALKKFIGDMQQLPDFKPQVSRLLTQAFPQTEVTSAAGLSKNQKLTITAAALGMILLLALVAFACVITIRLWPYAFPAAVPLPLPSATATVLIPTLLAPTATVLPTSTTVPPTSTVQAQPTNTPPLSPTLTSPPAANSGVLQGNLNVRSGPSAESDSLGYILSGERVLVQEQQGDWYFVIWPAEGDALLSGWIWGAQFLDLSGP